MVQDWQDAANGSTLEPFQPNPSQFCFSIGVRDPSPNRAPRDAAASGKTDSSIGRPPIGNPEGRRILRHYRRKAPCSYARVRAAGLCLILSQNHAVRMAPIWLKGL